MTTNTQRISLKKLATSLLNEQLSKAEMKVIVNDIYDAYQAITGITGYNKGAEYKSAVTATTGVAISVNHTARCLLDYQRTAQFLRATVRAIQQQQAAHPGECIRVLYAGCGPYAPFFTLVAPLFSIEEIQFTLLEINDLSLEKAKEVVNALQLDNYLHALRQADATTYRIPTDEHYHILFSETLDAVLLRECFVPILWNLRPQLPADHLLIPQNVIVHAALINKNDFPNSNSDVRDASVTYPEQEIGEIFNVAQDLAPYFEQPHLPTRFPTQLRPVAQPEAYDYLALYTSVQVYDDLWLHRGEGLLTEPLLLDLAERVSDNAIAFTYQLEPKVVMLTEAD